jgi:hypothetical protein
MMREIASLEVPVKLGVVSACVGGGDKGAM